MPRKGPAPRHTILPDAVYHSELLSRFINKIMLNGKKSTAESIVYRAFQLVNKRTGKDPLEVFELAMRNVMPTVEVRPRRVGGATYQVPMEVRPFASSIWASAGLSRMRVSAVGSRCMSASPANSWMRPITPGLP